MGRRKGTSAFPVARIKKMMQSDDDVGKIATVTPVLVAKALECMMENVLQEAADVATSRRTSTVTPQHLKACVMRNDSFDFLRHVFKRVETLQDDAPEPPVRRRRRQMRQPPSATPNSSSDTPSLHITKRPRSPESPPTPNQHQPKVLRTTASTELSLPSFPSLSQPLSHPSSAPPILSSTAPNDDDEDYDEDDQDQDRPDAIATGPETSIQPRSKEDAASPTIEINSKRTADRVSVKALLS